MTTIHISFRTFDCNPPDNYALRKLRSHMCHALSAVPDDLYNALHIPPPLPVYDVAPPSYSDVYNDVPPEYAPATATNAPAYALVYSGAYAKTMDPVVTLGGGDTRADVERGDAGDVFTLDLALKLDALEQVKAMEVDWQNAGMRERISKKKKQEQRRAQQAKWAESYHEGNGAKDGGDKPDSNKSSGDGGASAGGNGGKDDPPGGEDGDDNYWNMTGKKGKKKKKKKIWEAEEEEEKDAKTQEEEGEGEEKKDEVKLSAGGGFGAGIPGFLDDDPGDIVPDDEWGVAGGKKNKKKKGKVKNDLQSQTTTTATLTTLPTLASGLDKMSPGSTGDATGVKQTEPTTTPGFGGAWGGGGWSFGNIGNKSHEVDKPITTSNPWGFDIGASDSVKPAEATSKKRNPYDFDFGFGDDHKKDKDPWGLGSVDKKDKVGKVEIAVAETDALPDVDDLDVGWNGWAKSAKEKKKAEKKKAEEEAKGTQELDAIVPDPAADEADWITSVWGKDKKKEKKNKQEEDAKTSVTNGKDTDKKSSKESIAQPEDPAVADGWNGWGTAASMKNKKTNVKDAFTTVPPSAPTPPKMGLTPGPSPEFGTKSYGDDVDNLRLDDWPMASGQNKSKKDKDAGSPAEKDKKHPSVNSAASVFGNFTVNSSIKEKEKKEKEEKDRKQREKRLKEEKEEKEKKEKEATKLEIKRLEKQEREAVRKRKEKEDRLAREKPEREAQEKRLKEKEDQKRERLEKEAEEKRIKEEEDRKKGKEKEEDQKTDLNKDLALDNKNTTTKKEGRSSVWDFWGASRKREPTSLTKETTPDQLTNKSATAAGKDASSKGASTSPQSARGDTKIHTSAALAASKAKASASSPDEKTKSISSSMHAAAHKNSVVDKVKAFSSDKAASSSQSKRAELSAKTDDKYSSSSRKDKAGVSSPAKAVPGGFPVDDELYDPSQSSATKKKHTSAKMDDAVPPPPPPVIEIRPDHKSGKDKKKPTSSSARQAAETVGLLPPPPPAVDGMSFADKRASRTKDGAESSKRPARREETKSSRSPPKPAEMRSERKERPRVVRDQGSSSWGFWGASSKPKTSNRSPEKKIRDDVDQNASHKDKDRAHERPMPPRSKSMREHRPTGHGLLQPDEDISSAPQANGEVKPRRGSKAAQILGRSNSVWEESKQPKHDRARKGGAPDPYAIDIDNNVLNPATNTASRAPPSSYKKPREGESAYAVHGTSDHPSLRRSGSSASKKDLGGQGLKSLFGSLRRKGRSSPEPERDNRHDPQIQRDTPKIHKSRTDSGIAGHRELSEEEREKQARRFERQAVHDRERHSQTKKAGHTRPDPSSHHSRRYDDQGYEYVYSRRPEMDKRRSSHRVNGDTSKKAASGEPAAAAYQADQSKEASAQPGAPKTPLDVLPDKELTPEDADRVTGDLPRSTRDQNKDGERRRRDRNEPRKSAYRMDRERERRDKEHDDYDYRRQRDTVGGREERRSGAGFGGGGPGGWFRRFGLGGGG